MYTTEALPKATKKNINQVRKVKYKQKFFFRFACDTKKKVAD